MIDYDHLYYLKKRACYKPTTAVATAHNEAVHVEPRLLLRGRALSVAPVIPIVLKAALGQALGLGIKKVDKLLSAPSTLIQQLPDDAIFVSSLNGGWLSYSGQVLAAYYHPKCVHRASTKGKLDLKKSVAGKGKWAVSFQTRGLFGNKSNYKTCCGKTQGQCSKS
jgi:hypothetical protein